MHKGLVFLRMESVAERFGTFGVFRVLNLAAARTVFRNTERHIRVFFMIILQNGRKVIRFVAIPSRIEIESHHIGLPVEALLMVGGKGSNAVRVFAFGQRIDFLFHQLSHDRIVIPVNLVLHAPKNDGRMIVLRTDKLHKLILDRSDKFCAVLVKFAVFAAAADIGDKRNLCPDHKSVPVAQVIEIINIRIVCKPHRVGSDLIEDTEIGILHSRRYGIADAVKILMLGHTA